ncbi:MAG: UDP-N-acetylmuramate--L-alanine ligase [Terriglobia bacterium]|jgi:UDP-N-acetylmuramate--alanine ligase
MLGKIRKIHFVGIGGIGMSGIAEVLLTLGFQVSGSDQKATPVTERLTSLGARVFEGHTASNASEAQVVVVSSAVPADNPEIQEAQRRQVPVIPRAEMLAELMRMKFNVAVAGAHGKTTVTSMIAVMTAEAKLDPTAVIGGRLDVFNSSARLGKSDLMVVEADESDRSFLFLLPSIAVVTNIDREHLDHYRDLEDIAAAFVSFMNKVPFYGTVVACFDTPWRDLMQTLIPKLRRRVKTYGIDAGADIQGRIRELTSAGAVFDAVVNGTVLGPFSIHVPGRHSVQNALAAVTVGLELDLSPEQIRHGLERFRGADRRFQIKAEMDGITIVDDYGHHPTEIRATLDAAFLRGPKRVIAIFQPHRYTRTKFLLDELAGCFAGCDRVYVLDIYAASEPPIPGVSSGLLVGRMHEMGVNNARYAPSEQQVLEELSNDARPGDLIITIGAGSVWKIGEALAKRLKDPDTGLGTRDMGHGTQG